MEEEEPKTSLQSAFEEKENSKTMDEKCCGHYTKMRPNSLWVSLYFE
jgi:hypothetical protein